MSHSTAIPRPMGMWLAAMSGPAEERPRRGRGRGHRRGQGPWMGGPGGWMGGPPPWAGGPRGRRPRPRRGDVRIAILALLAEEPMHGYQIITELTERSSGVWQPSPGSIYPTLQQLQDEGLVGAEESDGRRVFTLTEAGATEAARAGGPAPWEAMADDADEGVARLRTAAGQVAAALMQVASAGTDAQVARAEELVTALRRDLYRLLAEDDETTHGSDG